MYILNWIYKKRVSSFYFDGISWTSGAINLLFFCDFLCYRFVGVSMLRAVVLRADTRINTISEKVEARVLGSSSGDRTGEDAEELHEHWPFT
mmetsp:Transcript_9229/g.20609  ORF Transcript_9229/g.20609 Transcript_9229/m.20609 type:complete len:92 (+) Transcript_9229:2-277(+)